MTDFPGEAAPTDPATALTTDTPCAHCGYNLRGLSMDGRCPECGFAIADSVRGDLLRYADSDWLQKLRFGTTLNLWNMLIGLVFGIGAAVLAALSVPLAIVALPAAIGGGLGLWAAFLITTVEPRLEGREDPVNLRKIVRVCAVLAFGGALIKHSANMPASSTRTALSIAGGVLGLAAIMQLFGELVYYRGFARRLSAPKLVRWTTIVLWGLPSATFVLLVAGLGTFFYATTPVGGATAGGPASGGSPPVALLVMTPFLCIGLLGALVFTIWYIVLLFGYRKEFLIASEGRESTSESHVAPAAGP